MFHFICLFLVLLAARSSVYCEHPKSLSPRNFFITASVSHFSIHTGCIWKNAMPYHAASLWYCVLRGKSSIMKNIFVCKWVHSIMEHMSKELADGLAYSWGTVWHVSNSAWAWLIADQGAHWWSNTRLHGSSCARPSSRTCPQETTVCEKLRCGSMSLEQADKFSYREYREGQLRGLVWGTVCCFGTRYPWTNLQKMTRQESSFVHPYPWAPELTPQWKSCGSSLWKHRALNLCLHTMIKKGIGTHLKMKCAI